VGGGKSERPVDWNGPTAERAKTQEKGGEDQGEMFFKTILNFCFKNILNSFLNSVKTTHHIKNATT
jgi:hypothetical protein